MRRKARGAPIKRQPRLLHSDRGRERASLLRRDRTGRLRGDTGQTRARRYDGSGRVGPDQIDRERSDSRDGFERGHAILLPADAASADAIQRPGIG